jgi:4-diphosphocytidyl-2C-methyl-D-erythritol kinase
MSGSGATLFAVFDNSQMSERAQFEMRAAGHWSEKVRAINRQQYWNTIFD